MFLIGRDYLSIWEVGHKWAGFDPNTTKEDDLPDEVQYYIQKIVEGYWTENLRLRRKNGYRIPRERLSLFLYNMNFWQKYLEECLFENRYIKKKLDSYFLNRTELIRLCEKEYLDPPEFWTPKQVAKIEGKMNGYRPKDEAMDKFACQAIAKTYWDIDPQIHPAHMAKSRAIRVYANGKQYVDEATVRTWVSEVDPLKDQRKNGRPKEIKYLIDLESGRLSQ